jgi:hypothetical protein
MENVEGSMQYPSVNTAIPSYTQFEIDSANFNFSSENKKISPIGFCWIC